MALARRTLCHRYRWSLLAALFAGTLASAQSVRLNRDLPRGAPGGGSDVIGRPQVTPDGQWAVYRTNLDGVFEIFSVPVDGSAAPRPLNGAFTPGLVLVQETLISPSSERVLYRAEQLMDGVTELWSAPIDGSAPAVRINAALGPGGEVWGVQFTPGGERVVYLADPGANDVFELWSAPVDGSQAPVRLNESGGDLNTPLDVAIAADGSSVVYRDDQATPGVMELWRAPIDGSAPAVRLLPVLAATADVTAFQISPDSTRVVYIADASQDGVFHLWSARLDGSGVPVRITDSLNGNRGVASFRVEPDSSAVVFRGDVTVDERYELYRAAIDGAGSPATISGALVTGGDVAALYELTPDGASVVFLADAEVDGVSNLYSVPVGGTPRRRLSDPGDPAHPPFDWEITADSSRVVYRTGQFTFTGLWSAPVDGSSATIRLEEPGQSANPGVQGFQLDPAGAWVAYYFQNPHGFELWSVPVDRSLAPRALQRAQLLAGFAASSVALTAARAVFVADGATDQLEELWSRPLDGSQASLRLNQDLAPDPIAGDVKDYLWALGGDGVVYTADQEQDERTDQLLARTDQPPSPRSLSIGSNPIASAVSPDGRWLVWRTIQTIFSAPLDASLPATEIGFASFLGDFAIAPDSEHVVMAGNMAGGHFPAFYYLMSLSIDGQSPAILLNHDSPGTEIVVISLVLSPDASRVVYVEMNDGLRRLQSARLDGTQPPQTLQAPLAPGRTIDSVQVSPDGARVVFRSDRDQAGVLELFSVPLTGGTPVRLHPALALDRDVDRAYRISPDGTRVVYVADADADEEFELFSTSILGSSSPMQLSAALAAGGDVGLAVTQPGGGSPLAQFEISADGTRVVYRADQDADEVFELYSVPIDGSAPPLRLHAALAPAGDVELLSTHLSPDGQTVVYAADALQDGVLEPFAVPIDAGGAPVPLAGPFVAGGNVWTRPGLGAWQALEIASTGKHLVYLADQDSDEVFELYSVRLDGSAAPQKLNGPLVTGGDVHSTTWIDQSTPPFRIGPDGRQVAYLADQTTDEVNELFLSWIDRARVRRTSPPTLK